MIINHKYEFIYLKTKKTASTSIEIALSQFCGPDAIITPISEENEKTRKKLGFRGPQNYDVPWRFYGKGDWFHFLWNREPKQFFNHRSAQFVRRNIEEKIWDSYFKFTFERNPFDKALSYYYWSTDEPRPDITDYLEGAPVHFLSNWNIYTINDQKAVDFIGHYENLADDLDRITDTIDLPQKISLPNAKSGHRPNRTHYSEVLCDQARARIELVCAKEMKAFGYGW